MWIAAALSGEPTMLPTPFTAEQIREAMPVGAHLRIQTHNALGDGELDWMVTEASTTEAVMLMVVTPEGSSTSEAHELRTTWDELVSHAAFSTAAANRRRTKVRSVFGVHPGWRYVVRSTSEAGQPLRSVMLFADAIPGPPVRMWTVTKGEGRWTFEQIERAPLRPPADDVGDG